MKRLFEVNGTYFESKMEAKAHRDDLNGDKFGTEKSSDKHHVVLGPDHIGPHGHKHRQHWRK